MPFNTDNPTTPPITKYRRFLSTGMIQLRNGSFLWGLNMTQVFQCCVVFFLTEWCTTFSLLSSVDAVWGQTVAACR